MADPISEIRKRAQEPVRHYNDIAGVLVGDHVSIHVTRLFIAAGISPTVATISMLVFGVVGSLLVAFGGVASVVGFLLVFLYYVCDCVDGEVARYHRAEKIIWGFHDFLFHLYVKSAFFLALGVLAVRLSGQPWFFLFGVSGLLGTLMIKFLDALAVAVTTRQIIMRPPAEHTVQLADLMAGETLPEESARTTGSGPPEPPRFGRPLAVFRAIVTNFDLGTLIFLAAALGDLALPTFELAGVTWSLTLLTIVFYGIVMPLDFLDRMQTAIRRDEFSEEARELLRRAHSFRVE